MSDAHADKCAGRWRRLAAGVASPAHDFAAVFRELQRAGVLGSNLNIREGPRGWCRTPATVIAPTRDRIVQSQGTGVPIAGDNLPEVAPQRRKKLIVSVAAPAKNVGISVEEATMIAAQRNPIILGHRTGTGFPETDSSILDLTAAVAAVS